MINMLMNFPYSPNLREAYSRIQIILTRNKMKQVTINRREGKVFVVVGDPDDRGNTSQRLSLTDSEAAMLLMKLKMAFAPKG